MDWVRYRPTATIIDRTIVTTGRHLAQYIFCLPQLLTTIYCPGWVIHHSFFEKAQTVVDKTNAAAAAATNQPLIAGAPC